MFDVIMGAVSIFDAFIFDASIEDTSMEEASMEDVSMGDSSIFDTTNGVDIKGGERIDAGASKCKFSSVEFSLFKVSFSVVDITIFSPSRRTSF